MNRDQYRLRLESYQRTHVSFTADPAFPRLIRQPLLLRLRITPLEVIMKARRESLVPDH